MENFNLFGFLILLGLAFLTCENVFEIFSEMFFLTVGAFIMVKFGKVRKNVKMENFKIKCKNI